MHTFWVILVNLALSFDGLFQWILISTAIMDKSFLSTIIGFLSLLFYAGTCFGSNHLLFRKAESRLQKNAMLFSGFMVSTVIFFVFLTLIT